MKVFFRKISSERKFFLRRVRLNQGGYDNNGQYFGVGAPPLYEYSSEWEAGGEVLYECDHLRASNREEAKKIILKDYPDAKFYR